MTTYEQDTLEYHTKERPGTVFRDLSEVPMKVIGKRLKTINDNEVQVQPEEEAITFYLLNHAMHEIAQRVEVDEPLGKYEQLVEFYHQTLASKGSRLFNYLMVICTRELRHFPNSSSWNAGGEDTLREAHGDECINFAHQIRSHSQNALFENDLNMPVGKYLNFLCDAYNEITWSGAYGGENWGKCTQPLRDVIHGESSIEMMLDVGFTLAHNNGPIFNKGFQYKHYNGTEMAKILDVQRGGQIPELVRSKGTEYVNDGHIGLLDMIEDADLMQVNPWVNWTMVEMLGAKESYQAEKNGVAGMHGSDPAYIAEMSTLVAKVQAKKDLDAAEKAKSEASKFEVMPGVFLEKAVKVRVGSGASQRKNGQEVSGVFTRILRSQSRGTRRCSCMGATVPTRW